jgi:hypothetical protein
VRAVLAGMLSPGHPCDGEDPVLLAFGRNNKANYGASRLKSLLQVPTRIFDGDTSAAECQPGTQIHQRRGQQQAGEQQDDHHRHRREIDLAGDQFAAQRA